MSRVKRGVGHVKRRKNLLKKVKGFRGIRRTSIKHARTAVVKAGVHALVGRRLKKRTFRRLWSLKLNAACRQYDLSYSQFIHKLKVKKIDLDRKVLADLAENNPKIFEKIIQAVK